jgi:DNA-binding NarL/FixJ family response regulator
MPELRVFVADDHAVVREGLKALIHESGMQVVGEADNGRTACEQVCRLRPDVVVMDVSMPEMNGIHATERLSRDCPDTRVLALTVHEQIGYLRRLFAVGARGYLRKRAAPEELVRAIRTVAAGALYVDPVVSAAVIGGAFQVGRDARALGGGPSAREIEVLRLLAEGYSNKEIGLRLGVSVKTVETHKARAMKKLGLSSRAEIVRYAAQEGWLSEG